MPKPAAGDHFESLFEYAPISLWEQDYSGIKKFLDELRASGVTDFDSFLNEHPENVDRTLRLIKVTHVNRETISLFGARTEHELLANLDKMFRDEMREHWRAELTALWNGEMSWSGDGVNYRLDGEALHIRLHWRILPECESNWECVLVALENITALKQAEKRFHHLFEYAPISLWEEDYSAIKQEFDSLRARCDGLASASQFGPSICSPLHGHDPRPRREPQNAQPVRGDGQRLAARQPRQSFPRQHGRAFQKRTCGYVGRQNILRARGHQLFVDRRTRERASALDVDARARKRFQLGAGGVAGCDRAQKAEEYLRYLGTHDVMTGLYNRAFFEETLQDLEANRKDPISFVIVDLNGLKLANDTFGHSAGDKLIRRTAEVLKASIEDGTIAARIGGDEFILIMPGADEHAAKEMIERVESLVVMNNKYYREPELSVAIGSSTSAPGFCY
ncbi:MAG: GGDEF domain-containing protein [Anaerolineales bacterium]